MGVVTWRWCWDGCGHMDVVLGWVWPHGGGVGMGVVTWRWCWDGCGHIEVLLEWVWSHGGGVGMGVATWRWCWDGCGHMEVVLGWVWSHRGGVGMGVVTSTWCWNGCGHIEAILGWAWSYRGVWGERNCDVVVGVYTILWSCLTHGQERPVVWLQCRKQEQVPQTRNRVKSSVCYCSAKEHFECVTLLAALRPRSKRLCCLNNYFCSTCGSHYFTVFLSVSNECDDLWTVLFSEACSLVIKSHKTPSDETINRGPVCLRTQEDHVGTLKIL